MNALTDVYCRSPFCPFRIKRGRGQLVGRIDGRAELRCPSCKQIALYSSTANHAASTVVSGVSRA